MSDEERGQQGVVGPDEDSRAARSRAQAGRRRRLLVRYGIVVLALLVLVVAPGYYATRPAFLARYTNLDVPYRTWSSSTHKGVACQSCHVPHSLLSQAAYSARMLGEFYASLVSRGRTLDVFAAPANSACQGCHVALVTTSPTGDLVIPHRAHVEVLKMQCVKCHAYLVHEKSPEGKHAPPMAACLTCHDGTVAKSACVTCHTAKAAPDSHKAADWLVIHASQQKTVDCAKCHGWTKDWCADCHSRRPPSHTADWRTKHPVAVKTHRDCEVCHTAASCTRCHGDVPQLNFDPGLKLVP